MRTGNPTLNDKTFSKTQVSGLEKTMTIQGTTNKTFFLLALLVAVAGWAWTGGIPEEFMAPALIGSSILGLIVALITIFFKKASPTTAPIYALVQGVVIGLISKFFESSYPGIVLQAAILTFGTLFSLLFLYKSRLIKVTANFKLGITAATGGIFLVYIANFVLSFFGFGMSIPMIHESGLIGIGFSAFVVIIAALNLVLDFDFIENASQRETPKYMEWYAAFGLMVTLIWLYLEILRLLAKIRSR